MHKREAFSLVEVLVAMVIVSLITATGMFAFKLSLGQIDRGNALTFSEVLRFSQLKNLINATYFYVIEEKGNDNLGLYKLNDKYLFKKAKKELEFVSDGAILSHHLSLVRLKIVDDTLIYSEQPIYSKETNYKNPQFRDDANSTVLLSNIKDAYFSFEMPIDLPKDTIDVKKIYQTRIPKLVTLHFKRGDKEYSYIFDIKYNLYKRKDFLRLYRSVE